MSKISEFDFNAGTQYFLSILEHQPNLIEKQHPVEAQANRLAEMAVSFSLRFNELKKKHVDQEG